MKIDVTSFDGQAAGSIELSDDIFGLEPRADLIHRMIRWQLAKRRAGTHAVKNRADIARTGKKMYKQKGTGRAQAGETRSPLWRKGGTVFGPQPRGDARGDQPPAAIRPPIIQASARIVAWVLERTLSGMIEPSTTRRPATPRTRHAGSTTASGSASVPRRHDDEMCWPVITVRWT